ncbi:hypothetical protein [Georgenia sp. SUBG003]|uniref:hypothetical protein n=1 Tax=Georgenia sp. SUBG003 TaxID=1497974 RepID=UPI0004D68CA0|nr:hypothetical protein DA06_10870 [Georgenia sp. SUBG003]
MWDNPRIQQNVQKVESRVTEMAKERGSAVTDKLASTVKDRLHRGGDQSPTGEGYSGGGAAPTGTSFDSTPPQSNF